MLRLAALAVLITVVGTAAAKQLEPIDVFPAGMNGVKLYRIPGMVVTQRGTVLAYCEARRHSSADWGEIEVHLRRSLDGGKSWLPATKIAHQGPRVASEHRTGPNSADQQTVNNPVAIVDVSSDRIVMLYCLNYSRCFQIESKDDGVTWSSPVEVTSTFEPLKAHQPWNVIATGPGHGITLANGRMIVPIWLAYGKPGAHHPSFAATIYSDDGGREWHAGQVAVDNRDPIGDPNESFAAVQSDGSVLLMARNVSSANRKVFTRSSDGATNWSPATFHPQLLEPICMASLIAVPDQPGTLIYCAPNTQGLDAQGHPKPRSSGPRRQLTIKVSRDDGQQWSEGPVIESGPSAYSDLALLNDGTLLCLYEGDHTIRCVRLAADQWNR